MSAPIRPATLAYDAHGTPFSDTYGDVYHSCHGGPGQVAHVFLQGNDLPARWRDAARFVILETGFGTGLNFLTTAEAWLDTPHRCARLHYLALEKHPFGVADLARLHEAWPHLGVLAADLRAGWPPPLSGSHRIELAAGRIVLTLFLGDAVDWLPRIQASVDAYYLDGFAPDRNPDLWSGELCNRLARLAAPGATLATWSVAGPVRRALAESGFSLERRPGYAGKREMLVGRRMGADEAGGNVPPAGVSS